MITIYGIPNCDVIKKTQTWLKKNEVPFRFYDYRKDGLSAELIRGWLKHQPMEKILNKASTSWKELSEEERQAAADTDVVIQLMIKHPTLVKRPVVENEDGKVLTLGFSEKIFEELLK